MKTIKVRLRGGGELEKFAAWAERNGGRVTDTSAGTRGVYATAEVKDDADLATAGLNDLAEVIPQQQ
jgi:hypothetical protein